MSRSPKELADVVMSQILGIHGGRLPVSLDEAINDYQEDPVLGEILAGLAYLHEDLEHREQERSAAQTELERQNRELQTRRIRMSTT